MALEKEIQILLRSLGVNHSYRGFEYTSYGISLTAEDNDKLENITKDLYIDIASKYRTSWQCVERDIRTVIDVIWKHGDKELLEKISGRKMERKPRNTEFIDMMAKYARTITRDGEEK